MPRSLGFGLPNTMKAVTESSRTAPFLRRPGHFFWPSKARALLDPACSRLPVRSCPSPRQLSRGLSPLRRQLGLVLVRRRGGRTPAGSLGGARACRPEPGPQQDARVGQEGSARRGAHELRPQATTWGPGAPAVGKQPRARRPERPSAGPQLARGALPTSFLLPCPSERFGHLLQTTARPSPDPAPQHLSADTHLPSRLTHPSRLRSLRLGGGRSGTFSGSFGRQYGGPAGRRPDGDKRFTPHKTRS